MDIHQEAARRRAEVRGAQALYQDLLTHDFRREYAFDISGTVDAIRAVLPDIAYLDANYLGHPESNLEAHTQKQQEMENALITAQSNALLRAAKASPIHIRASSNDVASAIDEMADTARYILMNAADGSNPAVIPDSREYDKIREDIEKARTDRHLQAFRAELRELEHINRSGNGTENADTLAEEARSNLEKAGLSPVKSSKMMEEIEHVRQEAVFGWQARLNGNSPLETAYRKMEDSKRDPGNLGAFSLTGAESTAVSAQAHYDDLSFEQATALLQKTLNQVDAIKGAAHIPRKAPLQRE